MSKREEQQKLWVLLGQVTSARRWHGGLLNTLHRRGLLTPHMNLAHEVFTQELHQAEIKIREQMKNLK
jgi:hypothetical protein